MRFAERRASRRYWHQIPWRSCNETTRGLCLRCFWRDITGSTRRAKAAHVRHVREVQAQLTPVRYRKSTDGKWRREMEEP